MLVLSCNVIFSWLTIGKFLMYFLILFFKNNLKFMKGVDILNGKVNLFPINSF